MTEIPENGRHGLKHWKEDLVAGLIVSLVSVPLSLGIAIASGAPPIAGLTSSIIAGLIFPFLGGAYMTISGPAAGLAPVVFASILALGHGHMDSGYHLVLAVICIAGLLQVLLSFLKAARLSALFPAAAIEGMLASIGLLIIAKQIPNCIGHEFKSHEFFGMLFEAPHEIFLMNPKVFLISLICLGILFGQSFIKHTRLKYIPPQLIVVFVGIGLGQLLNLDPRYMIHLPGNIIEHGLVLPDFAGLFHNKDLWFTALGCAITLTLVDGCESLATIMAIDKIDPYHRKSNPDRTLFAMGMSNFLSSLAGGLTIIPGGIKSTTCILAGGKTLWANFYNACFLIAYLFLAKELINMIPFAALAAVLIHIGFKLCAPHKWVDVAKVGPEQLIVFGSTVLVTLNSDLLWGLIFGTVVKFIISFFYYLRAVCDTQFDHLHAGIVLGSFVRMFRNPVALHGNYSGSYIIRFDGPVVCFNNIHLNRELSLVPKDARRIQLHFSPTVGIVDHSSVEHLLHYADDMQRRGRTVEFVGLEDMKMCSRSRTCMRLAAHRIRSL